MRIYGCDASPHFGPVERPAPVKGRLTVEPIHPNVQSLPASIQKQLGSLPIFVSVQPTNQQPDAGPLVCSQKRNLMGPQLNDGRASVLQLDQMEVPGLVASHDVRHPGGRPRFKPRQTDPRPLLLRRVPQVLPELPLPQSNFLRAHPRVHQRERRVCGFLHGVPRWLLPLPG